MGEPVDSVAAMSFFDPLPPQPDPNVERATGWAPPLWDRPSEAIMGAPVGTNALLARTDRVAVSVGHFEAYPNGFTFELIIRGNPMSPRPGGGSPGSSMIMMGPPHVSRGPRLGLELADGQRAVGGQGFELMRSAEDKDEQGIPTSPVLMPRGGGGGGDSYAMRYWSFPLPPVGPLKVFIEWEDFGIPETMVELDATPIRDASSRAIVLWEAPVGHAAG